MKTFLLCPGTERSGTTWLYLTLLKNKNVNFGTTKEYHYFDSLHIKPCSRYIKTNKFNKEIYKFYENENNYFNYFDNILKNYSLTGDISPGYSGLNENIFLNIKNNFEKLNINVKTILLLRNPISRHISAVNLRMKRNYLKLNDNDYNKIIVDCLQDQFFMLNFDYQHICKKIINVFNDDFMIIKYENLFKQKTMDDICNFLNISSISNIDFDIKINETFQNNIIYQDTLNILKNFYKEDILFYNSL